MHKLSKKNTATGCRLLTVLMVAALLCLPASSLVHAAKQQYGDYRDTPGISAAEIAAVEQLKNEKGFFIFGSSETSETFRRLDGGVDGWTPLFCNWLSEYFGAPFKLTVSTTAELYEAINTGRTDFTGEIVRTPATLKKYLMTGTIASRTIKAFRLKDSKTVEEITKTRPVKIGLLFGDAGLPKSLLSSTLTFPFETVPIHGTHDALQKASSGAIDIAVLDSGHARIASLIKGVISDDNIFPYTFIPVTLSTKKKELEPIINVLQKYLASGGMGTLTKMHHEGEIRLKRENLLRSLTDKEKAYLAEKISGNMPITVSAMGNFYPYNFYDAHTGQWQGIAIDVLREITALTGLSFEAYAESSLEGKTFLDNLESGQALMSFQLHMVNDRVGRFLWADKPYSTDRFVFISRNELDDLEPSQLRNMRVGAVRGTVYDQIFHRWFPEHESYQAYANRDEGLSALENGEIDLWLASTYRLLRLPNYMENANFKVNLILRQDHQCYFGFNKHETLLRGIISKAQEIVDTDTINARWAFKVSNYRGNAVHKNLPLLVLFSILLIAVLAYVFVLLAKNRNMRETLEKTVEERTKALTLQTSAAEQVSKRKSDFLAHISHEFRTPLNAIIGMTHLIQKIAITLTDTPKLEEYANAVMNASARLNEVLGSILDMSRVETNHFVIEKAPFCLSALLDDLKKNILPCCTGKDVSYKSRCDPTDDLNISADRHLLTQVLFGLMSNAVDFIPNSCSMHLHVRLAGETSDKYALRFKVSITNMHMNTEQITELFSPFLKDKKMEETDDDVGFSMFMNKALIQEMGGKIRFESKKDIGFSFYFTLPVDKVMHELGIHNKIVSPPDLSGKNIMVVDDTDIHRTFMLALLEETRATVFEASNGKEGVTLYANSDEYFFDLIFMDIQMPKMDGHEATRAIRNSGRADAEKIVIFALSANAYIEDVDRSLAAGVDEHLTKPVDIEIIKRKMSERLLA